MEWKKIKMYGKYSHILRYTSFRTTLQTEKNFDQEKERTPTFRKIKRAVLLTHKPTQKHHIYFCPTASKVHPPADSIDCEKLH